jgi:hypothetical protein
VSGGWYVVILCCAALAVLVAGQWFVRHELRTRRYPPPALLLWLAYAGVAAVVIFGTARTSWVMLS